MKQLYTLKPIFNPTAKTLDFSLYPSFDVSKLYAVINVTQNTPIYVAGAPGLGITTTNGSLITLAYNTTTHNTSDVLNVYYETKSGYESNSASEQTLLNIQEVQESILTELKVMNLILAQGLNININDIVNLRDDFNNSSNN